MRVVYCTQPHLLDPALLLADELKRRVELHLLLELPPGAWSALPGLDARALPEGIVPADGALHGHFPLPVQRLWQGAASFHLAVYHQRRALHPLTWRVSAGTARFVCALAPDLIHLDDTSLRLGLAAHRLPNVDLVNVHDPEIHSGERDLRRELGRRLLYPRTRTFILHNRTLQAPFARHYRIAPSRLRVVHLGVYHIYRAWARRPVPQGERTVLFFGRLSAYKGLEVLYGAAPLVARAIPGVRFVVAGQPSFGYRPPEPPPLPNGGVVERIEGHVSNERAADLFQRATVVACPYVGATQSGVVLTSYAFDRPVVATMVGGMPEYVEEEQTGLLVPPRDAPALAEALVRVLTDSQLQRRLRDGIAALPGGEIDWGTAADRLSGIYGELLAR